MNEIDKIVGRVPQAKHLYVLVEDTQQKHGDVDALPVVVAVVTDISELLELKLPVLRSLSRELSLFAFFNLRLLYWVLVSLAIADNYLLVEKALDDLKN